MPEATTAIGLMDGPALARSQFLLCFKGLHRRGVSSGAHRALLRQSVEILKRMHIIAGLLKPPELNEYCDQEGNITELGNKSADGCTAWETRKKQWVFEGVCV